MSGRFDKETNRTSPAPKTAPSFQISAPGLKTNWPKDTAHQLRISDLGPSDLSAGALSQSPKRAANKKQPVAVSAETTPIKSASGFPCVRSFAFSDQRCIRRPVLP